MRQDTALLIKELRTMSEKSLQQVQSFKQLDAVQLNYRAHAHSWSILECLEHLNLYGDFYLPEIERAILLAGPQEIKEFKSGWLGNYFAELMRAEKGNTMASPKDKNPIYSSLSDTTIIRFEKQCERLKHILDMAEKTNLNKVKCSISLTRFIKLKLGDTLRFYIYHIDRHVKQASRVTTT